MPTPAQIADEELRAQLWRDERARRVAYQQRLWWALAGDPAAYVAVRVQWLALELWLAEHAEPIVDPCDDPELDPLGMSDTVNVGE